MRYKERERERVLLRPLAQSPNDCNGQSWAKLNPHIRSLFQISHMDGKVPKIWATFSFFPRIPEETGIGNLVWDVGATNGSLTRCTITTAPNTGILKHTLVTQVTNFMIKDLFKRSKK